MEDVSYNGGGTFVCPLDIGRGIGTETSEADYVFPPDDLRFGSDTDTNCVVVYELYLDFWWGI